MYSLREPDTPVADTKLKADIAESETATKLLKLGHGVLKPIGDRLPYDLVADVGNKFIRLQVKSAWYDSRAYHVDTRRTKTNRRKMLRARYTENDFDFAVIYIEEKHVFYILPVKVFNQFKSGISLVEEEGRQRRAKSADYREAWHLIK